MNNTFSFLTYNVDSGSRDKLKRLKILTELIKFKSPDFISLQEITVDVINELISELKNKYYYYIPKIHKPTIEMILSKHPFANGSCSFQGFNMTKHARGITIAGIEKKDLIIASSQFEKEPRMIKNHLNQLKHIFPPDCNILLGCDTRIREHYCDIESSVPEDWKDSWYIESDYKYTYDCEKNDLVCGKMRDRRDRIYIRGKNLKCIKTELCRPTSGDNISSHFGILCKFELI